MGTLKSTRDDEELNWLFEKARDFPLLSATEERAIDERKWAARDRLLERIVNDPLGQSYLRMWSDNVLNNPPSLTTIAEKKYYYLLRREQSELYKQGGSAQQMERLRRHLDSCSEGGESHQLMPTLVNLNLSPPLVVGFAHVLLNASGTCELSEALRYWQQLWPDPPRLQSPPETVEDPPSWNRCLREYFTSRESLVNHNLRLVFSIAGKLQTSTVSFADLVQSGVIGLLRAAEKFDYQSGHRFSTYAYNWISQSARSFLEEQRAIVRLPSDVNSQVNRLYRERLTHLFTSGQEPSLQQLAERLQTQTETVKRLQHIGNLSVSFDSTYDNDPDGPTVGDRLSGWTYPAPPNRAEQKSLNRCLMNSLEALTKQEQRVITLRWGLNNDPPLSRREMADQLNISAERIRQIEVSALGKLRSDVNVTEAFRDYRG